VEDRGNAQRSGPFPAILGYYPALMGDIDRVIGLLQGTSVEKQIAATIVLGELGIKSARCTDELGRLVESEVPLVQRHALDALARLGAKKALPRIFARLASHDADVRRAAAAAVVSIGPEVVPAIRARMPEAGPEERRALDGILAELGGKEAFSALIAGLAEKEGEAAHAAALALRQRLKSEGARQRKTYLAETERFLSKKTKDALAPNAVAAAIKILGFLEDPEAIPTVLAYVKDKKALPLVRQEAVIALRFALGDGKAPAKVIDALLDAAESDDRTLAQTALHTLGALPLPAPAIVRLDKLTRGPDPGRAAFVIALLGKQETADATRTLVDLVLEADRRRAELAVHELEGKELAAGPLARALADAKDPDRAWLLRNVLRPLAKKIAPALRKELLGTALDRLESGERGWEALLEVVRDADPDAVAGALRSLANKLRKHGATDKAATVLTLLCRTDRASDDDRYAVASLLLGKSGKDTRPAARAGDEALGMLSSLLARGYDIGSALRRDRALDLEQLYYVGFHFAEEGHSVGEELLTQVVDKGGRAKVAKMAKNKLALSTR
jgi:HEAT repeat protein